MSPDDPDNDSEDDLPKAVDKERTRVERPPHDPRLTEALDHELAKHEAAAYQPTRDELRDADADAKHWQAAVAERRRANLLARAAAAQPMPASIMAELADKSRAWLLDRLAELRDIAAAIPGGAQLAHRNLEAQRLDDVPTEEIRSQVADLELALAAELSSRR